MSKVLLLLGPGYFINGKTGIGAYAGNIVWGLHCDYDIVVPTKYTVDLPENAHPIILSSVKSKLIAVLKYFLPVSVFFKDYDVIINGSACFKKTKNVKQYNIEHDLMSLTEPQNYTYRARFLDRIKAKTSYNAEKTIAVSQTTKQVLHDLFKIDFSKIAVIPNITNFYIKRAPKNYFLFIGDMRKTKNLKFMILGFAEYLKKYNGSETLIIAGSKKFEYESLLKLIETLGIQDKVDFPGYVTEEQKIELFKGAKAFIFLSDNEGFGIPLLEAGVNRIPVLCSEIPVFHEVLTEDFGVFVDNHNSVDICEGFQKIKSIIVPEEASIKLKEKYSKEAFDVLINKLIGNN